MILNSWLVSHNSALFIFTACKSDEFSCDNGKCIPQRYVCNYINDCGDIFDDDEKGCCGQDEFKWTNIECVSMSYKCNCYADCSDSSDEESCEMACPWKLIPHQRYFLYCEFKP